jgi:hypothetical protein
MCAFANSKVKGTAYSSPSHDYRGGVEIAILVFVRLIPALA